jgi:hypothetical protein
MPHHPEGGGARRGERHYGSVTLSRAHPFAEEEVGYLTFLAPRQISTSASCHPLIHPIALSQLGRYATGTSACMKSGGFCEVRGMTG